MANLAHPLRQQAVDDGRRPVWAACYVPWTSTARVASWLAAWSNADRHSAGSPVQPELIARSGSSARPRGRNLTSVMAEGVAPLKYNMVIVYCMP